MVFLRLGTKQIPQTWPENTQQNYPWLATATNQPSHPKQLPCSNYVPPVTDHPKQQNTLSLAPTQNDNNNGITCTSSCTSSSYNNKSHKQHDLLSTSLCESRNLELQLLPHVQNNPDHHALLDQQAQLGWQQITFGQLAISFITYLQAIAPQINSIPFFSKLIQLVWQTVLNIWQLDNTHLHPTTSIWSRGMAYFSPERLL